MLGFEDSGRTFLVQADAPLWFLASPRHGGGVGFMNDKIGLFSNKRIWLQYAYHQPVRKVNRLSIGVRLAFISAGFDGGKVETGESGGSSDPVIPTGWPNTGWIPMMSLPLSEDRVSWLPRVRSANSPRTPTSTQWSTRAR